MSDEEEKIVPSGFENISLSYSQAWYLRGLIQIIPTAGGPLDILISEKGLQFRQKRLENFLRDFSTRLVGVEHKLDALISSNPEEMFDLFRSLVQGADATRSEQKRKLFTNILLNQIERDVAFDDSETATRLLNQCTDLHIRILQESCSAPSAPDPWGSKRVSVIGLNSKRGAADAVMFDLVEKFPEIPERHLRFIVSELVFMGLLKDEGAGRFGMASMTYFVPSELTDWFLSWISR